MSAASLPRSARRVRDVEKFRVLLEAAPFVYELEIGRLAQRRPDDFDAYVKAWARELNDSPNCEWKRSADEARAFVLDGRRVATTLEGLIATLARAGRDACQAEADALLRGEPAMHRMVTGEVDRRLLDRRDDRQRELRALYGILCDSDAKREA